MQEMNPNLDEICQASCCYAESKGWKRTVPPHTEVHLVPNCLLHGAKSPRPMREEESLRHSCWLAPLEMLCTLSNKVSHDWGGSCNTVALLQ